MRRRRGIRTGVIVVALTLVTALTPAGPAQAGTATLGGQTFTTGQSGCTGPLVGVYGASVLKAFILQAAQDYCNAQLSDGIPPSSAADVEYAAGGDSCRGDLYAATYTDGNEVGASTVFPDSCGNDGLTYVDPSTVVDTLLGVNVVEEIATCPGAIEPNGGAVNPAGTTPCNSFATDPGTGTTSPMSCSPAGLSFDQTNLLYSQNLGNERQAGGCTHSNAVQNRVQGAGDRITFCFNVFGAGQDICKNEGSARALAGTILAEIADVCGPTAQDYNYAQGYVSRAAVVADPRSPNTPATALQGCGIVTIGGYSGYNGPCDPVDPSTFTPANSASNPSSGEITCNGDLDVAIGRYQIWGYVHLDTNAASSTNGAARAFVAYAQTQEQSLLQQSGFLLPCQMMVKRSGDAEPYSTITATC